MKRILKIGAVIAASLTIATTTHAGWGGATFDFGVTNYLTQAAGTNTGWPTNQFGYANGQPVNVSQFDNLVLTVRGNIYSTNALPVTVSVAPTVTLTLIASTAGQGGPVVTAGTNVIGATNTQAVSTITYNDWPTPSGTTNCVIVALPLPLGLTNGGFTLVTNFPSTTILGAANWIGIYTLAATGLGTNANANWPTGFITNLDVSIGTKALVRPIGF